MKTITHLLLFCCLLISSFALSQDNWVSYSEAIKTDGYEGHRFRLEASVRAEVGDDSASARLWTRVDKKAGFGFFDNMWYKPIRNKDWKTYTIEGTIDTGAYQMAFGALCQYNGRFYYDDIKIQVEDDKGGWTIVFSEDFEKGNSLSQGIHRWEEMKYGNQDYRAEILAGNAPQGQHYLLIEGKGVPNFGVNNKAGKYADVNGIRLYYEVYGEGQPLVVLHGNGGSIAEATEHYPYFLAKNYKVIAIDSRAQGRSGDTTTELTYEQMASDVNELLNQLGIDSTYIWGHSDGAIVGLIIAKNYPDKVKKLVAFAANIVPDTTGIEAPIYHWIEKTANDNTISEKERKRVAMMWKHPNIPFAELQKIQAEVLIMSGDRDFVPLAHTLEIFRHIPKSQLCVIPGATHGAAWEKKELFREVVTDFFEKPFAMPNTVSWFSSN